MVMIIFRENNNLNYELLRLCHLYHELKKFYFKYMYFHFNDLLPRISLIIIQILRIEKINLCYE